MKLPDVPAKAFSFSAIIVGYLLIDDLTAKEQNALGNWLMLVAQVISTNAFYKEVQLERQEKKETVQEPTAEDTIEILEKMLNALSQEIEELKKNLK